MASKKTRLEDLAALAGVSTATVSRALNDSPAVNDRTKRAIWKLAREQGYGFRPNMPTSLSQSVATISIVVPTPQGRDGWLLDPFFLELLGGIGEAARDSRCDFLVSHASPQSYDDLSKLVEVNRSDGVIFLGQSYLHERLNRLAAVEKGFIVWGGELPGQRYCSVGSDNVRGGRRAAAHLLRLGRRRIAFIGDTEAPEVRQRFEGYKDALARADVAYDEKLVSPAHFEIESAQAAVDSLIAENIPFDAVFGGSDAIAIGAIRALTRRGVSVPDDISVVGYDDVMLARYSQPALTTIRQDLAQAGRLMVSKLLNARDGGEMISERLDTNIIVRDSCGA